MTRRRIAAGLAGVVLSLLFITSNQASPVSLPQTIAGGEDSEWFVTNEGGVGSDALSAGDYCDGSPGFTVEEARIGPVENARFAFDNGATIWVNGSMFSATTTGVSTVDRQDRRIKTVSKPMGGVNVSAEYYVAASTATLRTLANFQNPSNSTVTITASFRTNIDHDNTPFIPPDQDGVVTPTATGDGAFTRDDRWVITGDPNDVTPPAPAVVTHVLWGPDAPEAGRPTAVQTDVFACPPASAGPLGLGPNQGIGADYEVVVPPRATRSLMFFNQLNGDFPIASEDTMAAYDSNDTLGADRLFGLGPSELLQVVNWKFNIDKFFVTAPGPGPGPHIARIVAVNPAGTIAADLNSFQPFETTFQGGVTVATGDVDGDGLPEVITAPATPGRAPEVRVWKLNANSLAVEGGPYATFFPYGANLASGVFVAAGDVNGDGNADIITGPERGGPHVRVFRINTAEADPAKRAVSLSGFFAFPNGFGGGVRVATGNIIGDKKMEIVTGSGPGTPGTSGQVRVFGFNPTDDVNLGHVSEVLLANGRPGGNEAWDGLLPYDGGYDKGVFVGTGDFVGDAHDELITGSGPGVASRVKVFSVSASGVLSPVVNFLPYGSSHIGGVNVASGDLDGDTAFEALTGPGPGVGPIPRTFNVGQGSVTPQLTGYFAHPNPAYGGGIFVSGFRTGVVPN